MIHNNSLVFLCHAIPTGEIIGRSPGRGLWNFSGTVKHCPLTFKGHSGAEHYQHTRGSHQPLGLQRQSYMLRPLESILAKIRFAALIILVSIADKAKSDDFDLWADLELTCDLFEFFFQNYLENYFLTSFEFCITRLAVNIGFQVSRRGGGAEPALPQRGTFGAA